MAVGSIVSNGIYELIKDFSEFEKEFNKDIEGNDGKINDFVDYHENYIGNYVEFNSISQIIYSTLENIKGKGKGKGKQNVLIIDDLERLDPGHIFRILNILSSHYDEYTGNHKFGFDKVIVVCNLNSLETIYNHLYGDSASFPGYINKFYSVEPFNFDNKEAIKIFISELQDKINDIPKEVLFGVKEVLFNLENRDLLDLRMLMQVKKIVPLKKKRVLPHHAWLDKMHFGHRIEHIENDSLYINNLDIPLLYVLRILKQMFGNYDKVIANLSAINIPTNEIYSEEETIMAITLLAIPERLNRDNLNELYNQKELYSSPHGICHGFRYQIYLSYKRGGAYNGEESYFYEAKFIIVEKGSLPKIKFYSSLVSAFGNLSRQNLLND